MGFKHRGFARAKSARQDRRSVKNRLVLPRLGGADRRALLTGTALASTLLIAVIAAPSPAQAAVCPQPASPAPISFTGVNDEIICVNTEIRTNAAGSAIELQTDNDNQYIDLDNSGTLTATGGDVSGIYTRTDGEFSDIDIVNSGDISATAAADGFGIVAITTSDDSEIDIVNSGGIVVDSDVDDAVGIGGYSNGEFNKVSVSNTGDITLDSANDDASGIRAVSYDYDSDVVIINSGEIDATAAEVAYGIYGGSNSLFSDVSITNSGDIIATSTLAGPGPEDYGASGISARTTAYASSIDIVNNGDITARAVQDSAAIFADTRSANSSIDIVNHGDLTVTTTGVGYTAHGIHAYTFNTGSPISITNTGEIRVTNLNGVGPETSTYGIYAHADYAESPIVIQNSGDITVTGGDVTGGILAYAGYENGGADDSPISITNSGDITVTGGGLAGGIVGLTYGRNNSINIVNTGGLSVSGGETALGIFGSTYYEGGRIDITNSGDITATGGAYAVGISAYAGSETSPISINNSGDITATGGLVANGIAAESFISRIDIVNSGNITATGAYAYGIAADIFSAPINITNHGSIVATGQFTAYGIYAYGEALGASLSIVNSGDITATGGAYAYGIYAGSLLSSVKVENSGSVHAEGDGRVVGIYAYSGTGTTIINTGTISASSQFAIDVKGSGAATIINSGTITGFVDLTEQDDTFTNQSGGVFEAKRTSLFGGGDDVFRNASGGTVLALSDGSMAPSFEGLERFENKGLISTVDGSTGDHFTISNTVGGMDLDFVASGNSRLAVDASLGGPGSATDTFTIEGNVSGTTTVTINNTNMVGGEFNPDGIKIVTVTGATPNANAFSLDAPVDAGFFDYDLFFTPTGSGFWSLKSFPGAGAHLLPQLVTAAQDMWHQGSSTWFDRTADLRVLVNGGAANAAYSQDGAANDGIAPAVWVRGSGGWLDRDGSGSTSSNGRNYKFDLDRQLDTMDFQMGLDLGSRDLLSQGDALVFGLLGGFVHGDLDYDSINRNFDYDGGQVGAYATYMKGGLFVDTLLNVHIMELDANGALGFPNNDLDATTVGLRSDAGYRFGSFSGGAFLEPLATLEVTWADIDGFSAGGNSVKFDDEANLRGRLGLRAGTTMEAWEGTMMEPFVTGSLWGNLSGENQATLVSNGSTFRYDDDIEDVWGELSAGVNFFNFSQTTSVFAKVDVTLGDDVTGLGGKAGMRVAW